MSNIFDSLSSKMDYNTLSKFKKIGYYSALGMSWGTIFTPWEADMFIIPLQLGLLTFSLWLNTEKTSDITKIKSTYDEVIKDYNKLNEMFGLKDPVSISAFFERFYRDGYLSKNKEFSFSTSNVRDVHPVFGANIMNGEGVCRHIAFMLDDIYKDYGVDSNVLLVYLRKRMLVPEINMEKQGLTRKELYEFIDSANVSSEEREMAREIVDEFIDHFGEHLSIGVLIEKERFRPSSNHAINFAFYNNRAFCLDPTNGCTYKLNREDPRFLCDHIDPKIFIDWSGYGYARTSSKSIKEAKKQIMCSSTTFEEDIEIMKKVQALYEDNLDIVDRFYSTHKEAYSDISNDLMKIKRRGRRTK